MMQLTSSENIFSRIIWQTGEGDNGMMSVCHNKEAAMMVKTAKM